MPKFKIRAHYYPGTACDGRVPPVTESVEPIGYDDEDNE